MHRPTSSIPEPSAKRAPELQLVDAVKHALKPATLPAAAWLGQSRLWGRLESYAIQGRFRLNIVWVRANSAGCVTLPGPGTLLQALVRA